MKIGQVAAPVRPTPIVNILSSERASFARKYRLASRGYQFLMARAKEPPSRKTECLAIASAVFDIVFTRILSRTSRTAVLPRLVVDTVDTCAWSLATDGPYDASVLTGAPLSIEAGLYYGIHGVATPAFGALATALVRRLRHRQAGVGAFSWQFLAWMGGMAAARYAKRWSKATEARLAAKTSAQVAQAHHAGRASIAMGGDSVLDALFPLLNLLEAGGEVVAIADQLHEWKNALASASGRASFLKEALDGYAVTRNTRPELLCDLTINLPEGETTALLTASQVEALYESLDALGLSGPVDVSLLAYSNQAPPGGELRMLVSGEEVFIPADEDLPPLPVDLAPFAALFGAVWVLGPALRPWGSVPLSACLPAAGAFAVLGVYGLLNEATADELLRPTAVLASVSMLLLGWAGSSQPISPEGIQRFPSNSALVAPALIAALCLDNLSRRERALLAAGTGLCVTAGVFLGTRPVRWSHLLVDLCWPYAAFRVAHGVRRALAAHSAELVSFEASKRELATSEAFAEGRSVILELVKDSRSSAWQALLSRRSGLDERVASEAEKRLLEIDKRLKEMA